MCVFITAVPITKLFRAGGGGSVCDTASSSRVVRASFARRSRQHNGHGVERQSVADRASNAAKTTAQQRDSA